MHGHWVRDGDSKYTGVSSPVHDRGCHPEEAACTHCLLEQPPLPWQGIRWEIKWINFLQKMGQTDMEVTVWEGRSSSLELILFLVDQGKAFTTKGQTGYTRISLQSRSSTHGSCTPRSHLKRVLRHSPLPSSLSQGVGSSPSLTEERWRGWAAEACLSYSHGKWERWPAPHGKGDSKWNGYLIKWCPTRV